VLSWTSTHPTFLCLASLTLRAHFDQQLATFPLNVAESHSLEHLELDHDGPEVHEADLKSVTEAFGRHPRLQVLSLSGKLNCTPFLQADKERTELLDLFFSIGSPGALDHLPDETIGDVGGFASSHKVRWSGEKYGESLTGRAEGNWR